MSMIMAQIKYCILCINIVWTHYSLSGLCNTWQDIAWDLQLNHVFIMLRIISRSLRRKANIYSQELEHCTKSMSRMGTHDDVIKWKHFPRYCPLCGNSPVTSEFPSQRPVTRSFDVFFHLHLNGRLSKQSWGCWFKTPLRPLWLHNNVFLLTDNTWNW